MTARATWASASAFCKRYATAQAAEVARARSVAASKAGVPTPAVRQSDDAHVVCFDYIQPDKPASLEAMLSTRTQLHRMPTAGLARFDPFLRIRPRLEAAPSTIRALVAGLATKDATLGWPAKAVVHGDFHPGQVIRDQAGKVWLIDLDDLALGPVEVDLGNLVAWMATQTPGRLDGLTADALAEVLSVAEGADATLTAHFVSIALVRRALKLQRKGIDWVFRQLSLRT
jgi:hypothetical protein